VQILDLRLAPWSRVGFKLRSTSAGKGQAYARHPLYQTHRLPPAAGQSAAVANAADRAADLLEAIEVQLLLEAIFRRYGFDFRNYALSSLRRRVWNVIREENLGSISLLQDRVLHDRAWLDRFLYALSVNVSAMFRDPSFYLAFRRKVVPLLRTYPSVQIWHAGCATGEEVYSMAILLEEEGLYKRCRIYATDMSDVLLQRARAGIFPLQVMKEYTGNYVAAGGHLDGVTRSLGELADLGVNTLYLTPLHRAASCHPPIHDRHGSCASSADGRLRVTDRPRACPCRDRAAEPRPRAVARTPDLASAARATSSRSSSYKCP